jgi:hypothetical protein
MIFIKVMLGLAIIVAPFQIRHCLKERRIPIRYGDDILWRDRPQAFWAYIVFYCSLIPLLIVLIVVLP